MNTSDLNISQVHFAPVIQALLSHLFWDYLTLGQRLRAPALHKEHMAPVLQWPDQKAGIFSKKQTPKHALPKKVKLNCNLTALSSPSPLQYSLSPPGLMREPQRGPTAPRDPQNAFLMVRTMDFALCQSSPSEWVQ